MPRLRFNVGASDLWVRLATCLAVVGLGACGSDAPGSTPSRVDADIDADIDADVSAEPEAAAPPPSCGPPPYAKISGHTIDLDGTIVGSVTITSSLCDAGAPLVVSGPDGSYAFAISQNAPVYFTLSKENFLTTRTAEFSFLPVLSDDLPGVNPFVVGRRWLGSFFPHYTEDTATILIYMVDTTFPCLESGITFSVVDQPEAKASYPGADGGMGDDDAGTSSRFAVLGALRPGGFASISGMKADCTLDFRRYFQTGNIPLFAGEISTFPARIAP